MLNVICFILYSKRECFIIKLWFNVIFLTNVCQNGKNKMCFFILKKNGHIGYHVFACLQDLVFLCTILRAFYYHICCLSFAKPSIFPGSKWWTDFRTLLFWECSIRKTSQLHELEKDSLLLLKDEGLFENSVVWKKFWDEIEKLKFEIKLKAS